MSYMQNGPWTPSEKVNLLVNVLQSTFPDLPAFLLQIIHENHVYPKWNDMPLPSGRSLHSSQIAFEEMSRLYRQQGRQPAQQQMPIHFTPVPNIAPAIPQQHQQPQQQPQQQPPPPPPPQQRPFHEPEVFHTQQRALQPRPPRSTDSPVPVVTNGEMPPLIRSLAAESIQEVRKKRGRPSKEEAEERDRALAAEGKVYQPKKRPHKKLRASTGTPGPESSTTARDNAPTTPLHAPLRRSSDHTQPFSDDHGPPDRPALDDDDEHSEKAALPTARAGVRDEPPEARSPSDRLLANHRERQTSPFPPPHARGPPHEDTAQR